MPFVDLTISRTHSGAHMSDLLAGGSTGMDMGTCINGEVSSSQNMHMRHNGTAKITSLAYYIQPYTGVYGGNFSPANDYARLRALGDLGGGDYGLHVCEDWNEAVPFTTFFKIRTGYADSYTNRRTMAESAMYYLNTGTLVQSDPTTPQAGTMAVNDDSAEAILRGNRALLRSRMSLPASEPNGGIRQWDWVFSYVYTQ